MARWRSWPLGIAALSVWYLPWLDVMTVNIDELYLILFRVRTFSRRAARIGSRGNSACGGGGHGNELSLGGGGG